MIVLNLCCENEHIFEGWFASAEAFDTQSEQGLVTCPACGSSHIARRPSAPYVNTGASSHPAAPPGASEPRVAPEALAAALTALRQVARSSEDVGERFPEEARRIHHGDAEARNIRGKASGDEVGELLEEGILVLPVPPGDDELH